jgi:hypothetical protein
VSSPQHRRPPLEVRERSMCMCVHGGSCTAFAPGHAVHLIQARLVSATPSEWVDAVVRSADPATGEIVVDDVHDGARRRLWNAGAALGSVSSGEPVAVHRRYGVLAARGGRFSVAVLD